MVDVKMKKIIFTVFCCILLNGCSNLFLGSNIEELLVAPQPTALQQSVVTTLKEYAGEKTVLESPAVGANIGALLFDDGTKTGKPSLIAFYSDTNVKTGINIALLQETNGFLQVIYSAKGLGTSVEEVRFEKLKNGTCSQLLVSYSGVTAQERYLVIYDFTEDAMDKIFEQDYKNYAIADLLGQKLPEVIFSLPSTRQGPMQLKVITFDEDYPQQIFSGAPSSSLLESETLCVSYSDEKLFIAVDGYVTDGTVSSELFTFSNRHFVSVVPLDIQSQTVRSAVWLKSKDIDDDGVVEQPVILPALSGMTPDGDYLLVGYYDFSNNTDNPKYIGIVNKRDAYFIRILPGWIDGTQVVEDITGFSLVDEKTKKRLFSAGAVGLGKPAFEVSKDEPPAVPVAMLGASRLYLSLSSTLSSYSSAFLREGVLIIE